MKAEYWIKKLNLQKHPEGGYYRETYRSDDTISNNGLSNRATQPRNCSTAIYYLLSGKEFSAFHRLKSDEIFHFYSGAPLQVHILTQSGAYKSILLGDTEAENPTFQLIINQGDWFASEVSQANSYSLIGCTVSPGFDFTDFELATSEKLINQYPHHQQLIKRLTIHST
ncbi:cupin domain-containing protein [Cyanobacterium stanieri LEGE 03274]|uniref:Cupin domain-containing protein n=1 Tax=Cyanobacterium stanieri LEGE 03274 TaxID=1828756 RepID=A0ABR9V4V8_9CHRO|nr:cupin domain-containing protein [Cyanobacterium stanieri LEGE 03274]